ncbi:hypothetical protein BJ878DRAFT_397084, partial [Calycina marina]
TRAQKRAQAQTKQKHEFVNYLMIKLDLIIYAELCVLYYMDCSFFRLLIRALSQMVFLSPKPSFIPPMPQHRPYIGAIFGPNIICILLHIFTARSEAGEAMRGYLHGGIIIDLIGQKGPTAKVHEVILDVLILVLQCFMLAVHVERERLGRMLTAFSKGIAAVVGEQPRAEVFAAQSIDAEERGVVDGSNEPLLAVDSGAEVTRELEMDVEERPDDDHPLDMFWNGTTIVSEFHVIDTLKMQWEDYGNASASALQTVGFSAGFVSNTANRRLNAASERFARGV